MRLHHCAICCALAGCGGDPATPDPGELITTVSLTFTPAAGPALVFEADDPDGDGGEPPTIDPLNLARGSYTVTVKFENRLEEPAEDITLEVADEATQHQVFFVGSGVRGPAQDNAGAALTHTYADTDTNGHPIGLANTFTANGGAGALLVVLRHVPPINGTAVKTADLAEQVRIGGLSSIGGENDANVTFTVNVQ